MSTQQRPQTADELGLMVGFPPAPGKRVTCKEQLLGPYNRWSFRNELKLNPTADVWRGDKPSVPFETENVDISGVFYRNLAGQQFTWDDMVELSYTDGIIVLRRGRILYERYLNGMQPHTLHCWASCSKSMTGTLAALLAHEGLFDPDRAVAAYLPELEGSGFADATVRQVMDHTTAVGFAEEDADPVSENSAYAIALGWRERPAGYPGPQGVYDFLPEMVKNGEHGERFLYRTPNTDVLAWLIKRLTNRSLAGIMEERIWSELGAERDAFWIVDPAGAETAGSGLITTVRDMARFGQMMLERGRFNGRQILPAKVVEDIERGADRDAFARGPAAGPSNRGYSYHHGWWVTHNPHGAYLGMGYGGQILYVDPAAQLVVAKVSSYPTPTPAGNEFWAAMGAIPALANALKE